MATWKNGDLLRINNVLGIQLYEDLDPKRPIWLLMNGVSGMLVLNIEAEYARYVGNIADSFPKIADAILKELDK